MQQRCPIIATPAGDLPRLYRKGRFGVLAGQISAEAIAAAIRAALAAEARGFQQALAPLCAEFDLGRVSTRLLDTLFRKGG
ncbi:MAG: hypothetical protein D6786_07765 [Gammaproteobacteria bacterium]|nr:MAG: hypothetical protein D6786_07765 [Gammaproteobacteria bacterium]